MCLESCFVDFPEIKNYSIYIDGSNIAYHQFNLNKKPILEDLLILIRYLIDEIGFERRNIHCICDTTLKYNIDKPNEYRALLNEGVMLEAPKIADEMILNFALKHEFCFIISNDRFRKYINQLPSKKWLEERRVSFMIIGDKISLSPNVDYNKIDLLPLDETNEKSEHKKEFENSTLRIMQKIEEGKGELDLY